jgi:hypothetical protein
LQSSLISSTEVLTFLQLNEDNVRLEGVKNKCTTTSDKKLSSIEEELDESTYWPKVRGH